MKFARCWTQVLSSVPRTTQVNYFSRDFDSYFQLKILSGIQILKTVGDSVVQKVVLVTLRAVTVTVVQAV